MKSFILISATLLSFSLSACGNVKKDKTFWAFNEGVTLNLNAADEQNKGNFKKAASLNKQSIEKFKETLRLDSTHAGGSSVLAHALYIDKQFEEAIYWFDQANRVSGEAALNYREKGLCKINLGQIREGKSDIDKSFSMDTTQEIREISVQDLVDVGQLAFESGDICIQEGESDKGKVYKKFSIGVLMLAFEYDSSKKEIASTIARFADKLGDNETAMKYKAVAGR